MDADRRGLAHKAHAGDRAARLRLLRAQARDGDVTAPWRLRMLVDRQGGQLRQPCWPCRGGILTADAVYPYSCAACRGYGWATTWVRDGVMLAVVLDLPGARQAMADDPGWALVSDRAWNAAQHDWPDRVNVPSTLRPARLIPALAAAAPDVMGHACMIAATAASQILVQLVQTAFPRQVSRVNAAIAAWAKYLDSPSAANREFWMALRWDRSPRWLLWGRATPARKLEALAEASLLGLEVWPEVAVALAHLTREGL